MPLIWILYTLKQLILARKKTNNTTALNSIGSKHVNKKVLLDFTKRLTFCSIICMGKLKFLRKCFIKQYSCPYILKLTISVTTNMSFSRKLRNCMPTKINKFTTTVNTFLGLLQLEWYILLCTLNRHRRKGNANSAAGSKNFSQITQSLMMEILNGRHTG